MIPGMPIRHGAREDVGGPPLPTEPIRETAGPRRRGRPALADEEVSARVARYCRRYGVAPVAPGAVPPFPSGRRETAQHREWLLVYRAVKRLAARRAGAPAPARPRTTSTPESAACAVCGSAPASTELRAGRSLVRLDTRCSELAARAREAGPDAIARLAGILWPSRPPRVG
jgi:hypothetical protein